MNELFAPSSVEKESPRLEWLRVNKIGTSEDNHHNEDSEYDRWACWSGDVNIAFESDKVAFGNTEDEAISNWAIANQIPLWNEQQFVREKGKV